MYLGCFLCCDIHVQLFPPWFVFTVDGFICQIHMMSCYSSGSDLGLRVSAPCIINQLCVQYFSIIIQILLYLLPVEGEKLDLGLSLSSLSNIRWKYFIVL